MIRYVGDLIDEIRRDAENEDTDSISTEDFLRYMNYGQTILQGALLAAKSTIFRETQDINLIAGQAEYQIDDKVWLDESLVDVKVTISSDAKDLYEIREISDSRRNYNSGSPRAYSRRSGKIILSPIPSTSQGFLRVIYERELDRLDIRRGVVEGITVASGIITTNTIDLSAASDDSDRIGAVSDKYICLCDKDGVVKARNIPYTGYNAGTGLFAHPAHTLRTGETAVIGDYVTIGKYTTTHLTKLSSVLVEKYLQLYTALKIFRRDSSNDAAEALSEVKEAKQEIIEAYQGVNQDEGEIQIDDASFWEIEG